MTAKFSPPTARDTLPYHLSPSSFSLFYVSSSISFFLTLFLSCPIFFLSLTIFFLSLPLFPHTPLLPFISLFHSVLFLFSLFFSRFLLFSLTLFQLFFSFPPHLSLSYTPPFFVLLSFQLYFSHSFSFLSFHSFYLSSPLFSLSHFLSSFSSLFFPFLSSLTLLHSSFSLLFTSLPPHLSILHTIFLRTSFISALFLSLLLFSLFLPFSPHFSFHLTPCLLSPPFFLFLSSFLSHFLTFFFYPTLYFSPFSSFSLLHTYVLPTSLSPGSFLSLPLFLTLLFLSLPPSLPPHFSLSRSPYFSFFLFFFRNCLSPASSFLYLSLHSFLHPSPSPLLLVSFFLTPSLFISHSFLPLSFSFSYFFSFLSFSPSPSPIHSLYLHSFLPTLSLPHFL